MLFYIIFLIEWTYTTNDIVVSESFRDIYIYIYILSESVRLSKQILFSQNFVLDYDHWYFVNQQMKSVKHFSKSSPVDKIFDSVTCNDESLHNSIFIPFVSIMLVQGLTQVTTVSIQSCWAIEIEEVFI